MKRVNPFEDLADFKPKPEAKPVEKAQIDKLAEDNNFPSRQARRSVAPASVPASAQPNSRRARRYTTGRNRQINIKATQETIDRLYRLADEKNMPLGELLDVALDALEQSKG
jgi:hypothetical protein